MFVEQIKKLFGVDPTFKWKVTGLVLVQFAMLFILKDMSWPVVVLTAYLFGGVINHALMLGKTNSKLQKEYLFGQALSNMLRATSFVNMVEIRHC